MHGRPIHAHPSHLCQLALATAERRRLDRQVRLVDTLQRRELNFAE
jgi:hypothetical protein